MFRALRKRVLDRIAVAVANRLAERELLSEQELERLADRLAPIVAQRFWQQPPTAAYVDEIAKQIRERELSLTAGDVAQLADRLAPLLAQRLATTPVLFGGEWNRVEVGEGVHLVNALMNVSSGRIVVGDQTFFGHNVSLITGTHDLSTVMAERHDYPRNGRDIVIGKGVWIASNVVVIGPCTIGDHAVIAAGAVVTCDRVESGYLYAGVPARKVRKLISEEINCN